MSPLVSNAITTMWIIAALHVVIVAVLSALFLIFRDAMEDDANGLHGVAALVLWIVLVCCVEGGLALARTLPDDQHFRGQDVVDIRFSIGLRTTVYGTAPFLALLALTVSRTFWKIRQDRRAARHARRLRGTLKPKSSRPTRSRNS